MSTDQPIRPPPKALAKNGGGGGSSSSSSMSDLMDSQETIKPSHSFSSATSSDADATGSSAGIGGSPPSSKPGTSASALALYPHLGNYVFTLIATAAASPPRASQHPLSVSSSGESDDSDDDKDDQTSKIADAFGLNRTDPPFPHAQAPVGSGSGRWSQTPSRQVSYSKPNVDKDSIVRQIVELLDNEQEDEVKEVLRPHMGDLAKEETVLDQICLECMHKRKGASPCIRISNLLLNRRGEHQLTIADDLEQLPYAPHLTPSRARASPAPSLNAHPLRPYTPSRVPSFRSQSSLVRPGSPSIPQTASGARTPTLPYPTSGLARSETSPVMSSGVVKAASPAGSPLAAAGVLSAKAVDFRPSPKMSTTPLSSSSAIFAPSADPWKDGPGELPRTASPFGSKAPGMIRTNSSNLAIAAPLFSDQLSPFNSPMGTPTRTVPKVLDIQHSSPSPSQAGLLSSRKGVFPDDDDDDEFSPFGTKLPAALSMTAKPFQPFGQAATTPGASSASGNDYFGPGATYTPTSEHPPREATQPEMSEEDYGEMAGGMTPMDVLHSVFTTLPRAELEDALHRANYDFESAMSILVAAHGLHRSGASTPQRVASPRQLFGVTGARGGMQHAPATGYFNQGGRGFNNIGGARSPGMGGGGGGPASRMCRYYLAGECRRSDCRFSHDLDRALCRFWMRGNCAKGPNCEFLHQLPSSFDPHMLTAAMSRVELGQDGAARQPMSPGGGMYGHGQPTGQEAEFPDLMSARGLRPQGSRFDPSRNRFANAVKRAPNLPIPTLHVTGARYATQQPQFSPAAESMGPQATAAAPAPRASGRLKLRPPTLLPTLKTGSTANEQYMTSRAAAIRLGYARNACLARAADAFRRGDGAAAKRFSREGKTLNERMMAEATEAAVVLVRERRLDAQQSVRERDGSWSDDPSDRSVRGKECGGGLGVLLGVASKKRVGSGGETLSAEERTEALLDLHTLHGNEGVEVLGQFLSELEREHFRGLAYIFIGEEKHVASQDPLRGAGKVRLGSSVKQYLSDWGFPWAEVQGSVCVDPLRF